MCVVQLSGEREKLDLELHLFLWEEGKAGTGGDADRAKGIVCPWTCLSLLPLRPLTSFAQPSEWHVHKRGSAGVRVYCPGICGSPLTQNKPRISSRSQFHCQNYHLTITWLTSAATDRIHQISQETSQESSSPPCRQEETHHYHSLVSRGRAEMVVWIFHAYFSKVGLHSSVATSEIYEFSLLSNSINKYNFFSKEKKNLSLTFQYNSYILKFTLISLVLLCTKSKYEPLKFANQAHSTPRILDTPKILIIRTNLIQLPFFVVYFVP